VSEIPPLQKFGLNLGLDGALLHQLSESDGDWSFVIKLHALMEAAVSDLLTKQLRNESLRKIFDRLEMSNQSTGKVAFIKALNLLPKESRRFLGALSQLRNDLAHNIKKAQFNFREHVTHMDAQALRSFIADMSPLDTGSIDLETNIDESRQLVANNARTLLLGHGLVIIRRVYLQLASAKFLPAADQDADLNRGCFRGSR